MQNCGAGNSWSLVRRYPPRVGRAEQWVAFMESSEQCVVAHAGLELAMAQRTSVNCMPSPTIAGK